MSLYNQACHRNDVQEGRIVNSGRCFMVAHDTTSSKDCILRGAAAMSVDLSKFSSLSGRRYGDPLDDPVCVRGFEKALSAG